MSFTKTTSSLPMPNYFELKEKISSNKLLKYHEDLEGIKLNQAEDTFKTPKGSSLADLIDANNNPIYKTPENASFGEIVPVWFDCSDSDEDQSKSSDTLPAMSDTESSTIEPVSESDSSQVAITNNK